MSEFVHTCVRAAIGRVRLHAWRMDKSCYYIQIHDILVNYILPVGILVTEHFYKTADNIQDMSLFRCFVLPVLVIHQCIPEIIHVSYTKGSGLPRKSHRK